MPPRAFVPDGGVGAIGFGGAQALGELNRALEDTVHVDFQRILVVTDIRRLFRSMVA